MIDKGKKGWLKKIWLSLTLINFTFSGMFASKVHRITYLSHSPMKFQHHFGPPLCLRSGVLAAMEFMIGLVYDTNNTNLYCLEFAGHIEFLDVEKESISVNLIQSVRDLFGYLTCF